MLCALSQGDARRDWQYGRAVLRLPGGRRLSLARSCGGLDHSVRAGRALLAPCVSNYWGRDPTQVLPGGSQSRLAVSAKCHRCPAALWTPRDPGLRSRLRHLRRTSGWDARPTPGPACRAAHVARTQARGEVAARRGAAPAGGAGVGEVTTHASRLPAAGCIQTGTRFKLSRRSEYGGQAQPRTRRLSSAA
jgi:hypothetical protein